MTDLWSQEFLIKENVSFHPDTLSGSQEGQAGQATGDAHPGDDGSAYTTVSWIEFKSIVYVLIRFGIPELTIVWYKMC